MSRPSPLLLLIAVAVTLLSHHPSVAQLPSEDIRALQADIARIIRAASSGSPQVAVLALSLDRGDTLVSVSPDLPLSPASNMKLYSTAAALHYLGPDFRYSTELVADGQIVDGVLDGDLILFGTGDPTISSRLLSNALTPFRAFADSLVALGVVRISGDLIGDGSYFDAAWTGPGWLPNDLTEGYGAPVGALSFAENVVTLRIAPGELGGPARVTSTPATVGLPVENRVTTVNAGSTAVRAEHSATGIVLTGQVRIASSGVTRTLPIRDPASFAAAALAAVLQERGIVVSGRVRSVHLRNDSRRSSFATMPTRAAPRLLASHRSPALSEIVRVTNHVSQNLYAEALLKTVGRAVGGEGSFAAGARAVARIVHAAGGDTTSIDLIDGSGLSRTNRLTARSTVHLLEFISRSNIAESFSTSLPLAGTSTGLRRMFATPAADMLRAKTGTVRNVSALAGYVTIRNGERVAFSILTNGTPSTARAKQMEDEIGARLAAFSRSSAGSGAN